MKRGGFCLLPLAVIFFSGCTIQRGVYHTVEKGQTLWRITKTYDVDIQDVAELNQIIDPSQIKVGQKIFIPGAHRVLKVEPYQPAKDAGAKAYHPVSAEPEGKIVLEKWRFSWPVKGTVVSHFGIRNGKRHNGIDITAPSGSFVYAADDGKVIYSDNSVRGYGNMVIVKHKDGFVTVYAHNKENLVKAGEVIKRGQAIAVLGESGNASVPRLHFEVRKDKKPRNPLFFLP